MTDAVVVGNAATERIVLWNAAAERLFGYSETEALRLFLHVLVPDELVPMHRAGLARYQATGAGELIATGKPVPLAGQHKDGRLLEIELTLTPIEDAGPNGDRFALAIIRDVSDRRLAEEARAKLADVELRRRQALELNDAIVQGLAVAKMALETGRAEHGLRAVADTLEKAKSVVGEIVREITQEAPLQPGDLTRGAPATPSTPEA